MTDKPESARAAFWRTLTKLEHNKIVSRIAFRNAVAVALPLCIGIATHNPVGGVAVSTGALNVSYSDGTDPYKNRARRMMTWTLLGGFAVFVGSLTGSIGWLAIIITAGWAFLAGLATAIGPKSGDLGLNTLVIVIVFAAHGAKDVEGAVEAGGLVILGGLLQVLLALIFWPIRQDTPQRRVLGGLYKDLAQELDPSKHDILEPQLRNPSQQVQDTVQALGRDHSIEGERYRILFDQADRLRRSAFVLQSLGASRNGSESIVQESSDQLLALSWKSIDAVGDHLLSDGSSIALSTYAAKLDEMLDAKLASLRNAAASPRAEDLAKAMDVFVGQLRVVLSLAGHTTEEGNVRLAKEEATPPWQMTLRDRIEILRANLSWDSTYFRHAIRLCICVTVGDVIGRMAGWQRSYWLPMSTAVVLKPDFTTTFSRGVLRFAGTFAGLLLATLLYHLLPVSSPSKLAIGQLFLVGLFTFALRSIGTANYGMFSLSISGLIVFLVAALGVPPGDVVAERALNTVAGGMLALIAYAVWPTWERKQVDDVIAQMLDAARNYFHEVAVRLGEQQNSDLSGLEDSRNAWRRARSNAEASADRLAGEPGANPDKVSILTSMLASSHALVHAVAGLEAGLIQKPRGTTEEAFRIFSRDIEFTLYFLAAAFRGSRAGSEALPKLREDYRRIVEARDRFSPEDTFLVMQTDRLVVALNTLREQAMRYLQT